MPPPRPAAPPAQAAGLPSLPGARVPAGRRALLRVCATVLAITLAPGAARGHEPGAGRMEGAGEAPPGAERTEGTGEAQPGAGRTEGTGEAQPGAPSAGELAEGTGDEIGSKPPAELAEETGGEPSQLSPGTGAGEAAAPGSEQATRWTAEGQRRRTAGDLDGAITAWQQAMAALPVTQATAHRRAGLALAIAAAHAETGRPERLRAAIAVLDAYLAGLDPTDDENRVAVEQRRAELAARGPTATARAPTPGPPRRDRRLIVAGGVGFGLAAGGLVLLTAGLLAGARADRRLAAAVALPGDDPRREPERDAAVARGLLANRTALAGGVIAGVLILAGVALTVAGAVKHRAPRRRLVPTVAAGGLRWRF